MNAAICVMCVRVRVWLVYVYIAIKRGRQQQQHGKILEKTHYLCLIQELTRFVVVQLDFWIWFFCS